MPDHSINAYQKVGRTFSEWVWYEGTGEGGGTELQVGQAVCYNWDYGTATTADGRRYNRVQNPTTANAQHFAGVCASKYLAGGVNGKLIEIYNPGSVCEVLVGASTVIGTGFLTFDVTAATIGQFRRMGLPGKGSAQPLQTTTYVATAQSCLCYLQEGPQSGGCQDLTAANGARTDQMVGGTTFYIGASIGGHNTLTLANGTIPGLRKKFGVIDTELTTNDIVITVTAGATDDVDDVSLDTITFAGASTCLNTLVSLYWDGAWFVQAKSEDVPVLGGS